MDQLRIGVLGTAQITTTALLGPAAGVPEVTVAAVAARDGSRADVHVSCQRGHVWMQDFIRAHWGHLVAVRNGSVLADERGSGDSTYTEQLRAFAAAIADGTPVPTSAAHAVTTMRLIDDAYRAAGLLPRGD